MQSRNTAVERIVAKRDPAFPYLSAEDLALGLQARLADPARIDQGGSSLCGPASLLYCLAADAPERYAGLIADLYCDGRAALEDWRIRPGRRCRHFEPGNKSRIDACDWVGLASVKDATNWVFAYDSPRDQFPGITLPRHLRRWVKAAGYRDVVDRTRLMRRGDAAMLAEARERWAAGERVWLLVDDRLFRRRKGSRIGPWPNHWVVLTRSKSDDELRVFSWGQRARPALVPRGEDWTQYVLGHFNGFIAARFRS